MHCKEVVFLFIPTRSTTTTTRGLVSAQPKNTDREIDRISFFDIYNYGNQHNCFNWATRIPCSYTLPVRSDSLDPGTTATAAAATLTARSPVGFRVSPQIIRSLVLRCLFLRQHVECSSLGLCSGCHTAARHPPLWLFFPTLIYHACHP